MEQYFLAVDIGASSGRHILGRLENGKVTLEEVYRFKNGFVEKNGHFCWTHDRLFEEIKNGLKKCKEIGKIPTTMGIDTWGVDFVLLDKEDNILGDTVAYRDSRTEGMIEKVEAVIPPEELYSITGIQKENYNTIYQLFAVKEENPEHMEKAETFLMTPEYFNFLLTGKKMNEYTIASTTGLLDAKTKKWSYDIIERLGYKKSLFGELYPPKTVVGGFTPEIQKEVGFDCTVVLPATHDTGSAVLSVPTKGMNNVYISSGTWSLMGVESETADCSEESRRLNFTNEGGVEYRYRYLKNIMGLWMLQSIKRELNDEYGFGEISDKSRECGNFKAIVDVNDNIFLAPKSMIEAVKTGCKKYNQAIPQNVFEVTQCVYLSLAKCYADTIKEIEKMLGRTFDSISIVGGGCQDGYLNELTAKATGKTVYAGPIEATALGNILAQMMSKGVIKTVDEARDIIRNSFEIKEVKAFLDGGK